MLLVWPSREDDDDEEKEESDGENGGRLCGTASPPSSCWPPPEIDAQAPPVSRPTEFLFPSALSVSAFRLAKRLYRANRLRQSTRTALRFALLFSGRNFRRNQEAPLDDRQRVSTFALNLRANRMIVCY